LQVSAAGQVSPWIGVVFGAAVLVVGAVVSRQMRRVEARHRDTSLGQEVLVDMQRLLHAY